ncbi:hypothetical protein [Acinetobacter piscicola]|uniref:hypothetical protein n=1 Tax=Acinetobacter piscicola TaxID=2006115 RepID=UPI000B7D946D|nr:hypothetical protein [Acinetobacter piscicola]
MLSAHQKKDDKLNLGNQILTGKNSSDIQILNFVQRDNSVDKDSQYLVQVDFYHLQRTDQ